MRKSQTEVTLRFPKPSRDEFIEGDSLEARMVLNYFYRFSYRDLVTDVFDAYDHRADLSAVVFFLTDKSYLWMLPSLIEYVDSKLPNGMHLVRSVLRRYHNLDQSIGNFSFVRTIIKDWLIMLKRQVSGDELAEEYIDEQLGLLN